MVLTRTGRSLGTATLPISLGLLSAAFGCLVLASMGPLWLVLIMGAIAVGVGGFLARDLALYWTILFVLAIPFRMGKMFFAEPAEILAFIEEFGKPQGALPVPQLLLADIPFLVMLTVFLLRFVRERDRFRMSPATPLVLGLVAWAGLSIINGTVKMLGIMEFARQLEYALIFVVVAQLVRERRYLWPIVGAVAVSLTIQSIYTLFQYQFDITTLLFGADATTVSNTMVTGEDTMMVAESGSWAGKRRGSGTVGHANLTAHYFEMWTPLVFAFAIVTRHRTAKFLLMATVIVAAGGLFLTFSRGGAAALGIGVIAVILLLKRGGYISHGATKGILGLAFAGCVVAAPVVFWYMTTRPEMYKDRFDLLHVGVGMVADRPILGVGVNHYKMNFVSYRNDPKLEPHPMHNYYLLLAAERGIPGVLFFVVLLIVLMRIGWLYSKSSDPVVAATAAGVFGMLAAVAIHMNFDAFNDDPGQRGFWFLAGILVAVTSLRENAPDATESRTWDSVDRRALSAAPP